MQIICKHNGNILLDYGYDNIHIDYKNITILTEEIKLEITKRIQFRPKEGWCDFEYGIGGFVGDEYYKIKNIQLADNGTKVIVKVSKVG